MMGAEEAQRGRKRTSLEVKSEAWAVLLSCESFAQASQGGGFKPGDVYEGHFKEHLDRTTYFHRLGMLRSEGFFYLDGRQKSPETQYFFLKDRVKLHRKVRDKWFPKGIPVWPTNPPGIPAGSLFDAPGPATASEVVAEQGGGFTNVMVEGPIPPRPREHTQPEPAYQRPNSTMRQTLFSCPLCGGQEVRVRHRLNATEVDPIFTAHCHSAVLAQCCSDPTHLFLIAFGEHSLHEQVIEVRVPGEW